VSSKSGHQVTSGDVLWADLILVMEGKHKARLLGLFPDVRMPRIESLDIPDEYEFMDGELVGLIREGTEPHLRQLGVDNHDATDE